VKTEGRHPEEGTAEARSHDNVVRLPRDWLGPRDELVPLAIGGDSVRALERDAAPPEADAFWGEGSAAVQSALLGPTAAPHRVAPASKRGPAGAADPRRWALVAGPVGALAAAVIAVVIAVGGGASTHVPRRAAHTSATSSVLQTLASERRHEAAPKLGAGAVKSRQSTKRVTRPNARRHAKTHRRAATTVTQVSYRSPVTTAAVAASTPSSSSSGAAGTASESSSGSGAQQASAPAGPTGPGAPFGPGHLQ
jgi:hypothetical protein